MRELYDAVPWFPERSEAEIAAVLAESLCAGAWQEDRLVGFARAISDGRFHAYIDDVVVHPDHRRQGLATKVVGRLVAALADVNEISLFCDEEHVELYERMDFRIWKSQRVLHLAPQSRRSRA